MVDLMTTQKSRENETIYDGEHLHAPAMMCLFHLDLCGKIIQRRLIFFFGIYCMSIFILLLRESDQSAITSSAW